jgi:hypothetical protein
MHTQYKKQNKMVSANLLHWHINRNHDLTILLFLLFTVSLQILVVQLEKKPDVVYHRNVLCELN